MRPHLAQHVIEVAGLANHFDPRVFEQAGDSGAQQQRILAENYTHRVKAASWIPRTHEPQPDVEARVVSLGVSTSGRAAATRPGLVRAERLRGAGAPRRIFPGWTGAPP